MTSSSNKSPVDSPAASSPSPPGDSDSAAVTSTGGMAAGSEGTGAEPGYIDDSQLPEDLRPDAEGLTGDENVGGQTLAEGATPDTDQLPDPSQPSSGDATGVSEPA